MKYILFICVVNAYVYIFSHHKPWMQIMIRMYRAMVLILVWYMLETEIAYMCTSLIAKLILISYAINPLTSFIATIALMMAGYYSWLLTKIIMVIE